MAVLTAQTIIGAGNKIDAFPVTLATGELTAATTADYIHGTVGDGSYTPTGTFAQKNYTSTWQAYDTTETMVTHLDTYNTGITVTTTEQLFENGDSIQAVTAPDVDKLLLFVRYNKALAGKIEVEFFIGFYSGATGQKSAASTTAFTAYTIEATAWSTQYLVNIPVAVFDATIVTVPGAPLTIPIGSQGASVFLDPA